MKEIRIGAPFQQMLCGVPRLEVENICKARRLGTEVPSGTISVPKHVVFHRGASRSSGPLLRLEQGF